MKPGPLDSPFGAAWRLAGKRGVCPLEELEDYLFDRWDIPTLCGAFPRGECVAGPGDWEPCEPPDPGPSVSMDFDLPF